ncbi:MAG TPA: VanZ family protein [Firmicutes bacterium]|nr:MAG: hypothetical protein AA931_00335 [Peptococcaceae bacterium 1109]HHT74314.1 VanZ family protein [Bacillota bacterium]
MVRWFLVALYAFSVLSFTTAHSSGAGYMGRLLREWFPHLTGGQIQALVYWTRKAGHVLAYGVLTLLIIYASKATPRLKKGALLWGAAGAFVVAVADEYLQIGLEHRSGSLQDVVIDCAGIALALLAVGVVRSRKRSPNGRDKDAQNQSG